MKVRILGVDYDVCPVPRIAKDDRLFGQIEFDEQRISIEESLSDGQKSVVLLHEILHGILYQLGHGEMNNEEVLTQGLASGLYQVLSDNQEELLPFLGLRQCASGDRL